MRILFLLFLLLPLLGCYKADTIRPSHIIEDAHGGGSIVALGSTDNIGASGGWGGKVKIWKLDNGQVQQSWQAHQGTVNGLVFFKNDRYLISAGYDGKIRKWRNNGLLLQERDTGSPITSMVAQPSAGWLVSGHDDGSIRRWKFSDLSLLIRHDKHTDWVRAVAISPNTDSLASSDADGNVYYWKNGQNPVPLRSSGSDMRTLAFSDDGQFIYGGTWFDIYRWDITNHTSQRFNTEHNGIINSIKVSADGKSLLTISRQTDSAVLALDANNGQTLRSYTSHDLCGVDIAISSSGQYLMTTSDDASVRIWDLKQTSSN